MAITIDLSGTTELTDDDKKRLRLLLNEFSKSSDPKRARDKPYKITYQGHKEEIKLSHSILKVESRKHRGEARYQILERGTVARGAFGTVKRTRRYIRPQGKDSIQIKGKARIVKIESLRYPGEPTAWKKEKRERLADIKKEMEFSRKVYPEIKETTIRVYNKHSSDKIKYYTVMPDLGVSLQEIIENQVPGKSFDYNERLRIINESLSQLDGLHQLGIIHRDIKPGNILYDLKTGEIRIIDFGLSQKAGEENKEKAGSLYYISPETFNEQGSTEKSDLFSMAAVTGLLLTDAPSGAAFLKQYDRFHPDTYHFSTLTYVPQEDEDVYINFIARMSNADPTSRPTVAECRAFLNYMQNNVNPRSSLLKALKDDFDISTMKIEEYVNLKEAMGKLSVRDPIFMMSLPLGVQTALLMSSTASSVEPSFTKKANELNEKIIQEGTTRGEQLTEKGKLIAVRLDLSSLCEGTLSKIEEIFEAPSALKSRTTLSKFKGIFKAPPKPSAELMKTKYSALKLTRQLEKTLSTINDEIETSEKFDKHYSELHNLFDKTLKGLPDKTGPYAETLRDALTSLDALAEREKKAYVASTSTSPTPSK